MPHHKDNELPNLITEIKEWTTQLEQANLAVEVPPKENDEEDLIFRQRKMKKECTQVIQKIKEILGTLEETNGEKGIDHPNKIENQKSALGVKPALGFLQLYWLLSSCSMCRPSTFSRESVKEIDGLAIVCLRGALTISNETVENSEDKAALFQLSLLLGLQEYHKSIPDGYRVPKETSVFPPILRPYRHRLEEYDNLLPNQKLKINKKALEYLLTIREEMGGIMGSLNGYFIWVFLLLGNEEAGIRPNDYYRFMYSLQSPEVLRTCPKKLFESVWVHFPDRAYSFLELIGEEQFKALEVNGMMCFGDSVDITLGSPDLTTEMPALAHVSEPISTWIKIENNKRRILCEIPMSIVVTTMQKNLESVIKRNEMAEKEEEKKEENEEENEAPKTIMVQGEHEGETQFIQKQIPEEFIQTSKLLNGLCKVDPTLVDMTSTFIEINQRVNPASPSLGYFPEKEYLFFQELMLNSEPFLHQKSWLYYRNLSLEDQIKAFNWALYLGLDQVAYYLARVFAWMNLQKGNVLQIQDKTYRTSVRTILNNYRALRKQSYTEKLNEKTLILDILPKENTVPIGPCMLSPADFLWYLTPQWKLKERETAKLEKADDGPPQITPQWEVEERETAELEKANEGSPQMSAKILLAFIFIAFLGGGLSSFITFELGVRLTNSLLFGVIIFLSLGLLEVGGWLIGSPRSFENRNRKSRIDTDPESLVPPPHDRKKHTQTHISYPPSKEHSEKPNIPK